MDVFYPVFDEMVQRGYRCVKLFDDDFDTNAQFLKHLDRYVDEEVTIITSSHLRGNPRSCISIEQLIDKVRPVRILFGLHDLWSFRLEVPWLNRHKMELLLPGDPWLSWHKERCPNCVAHDIGHPKFVGERIIKHDAIFFFSGVTTMPVIPQKFYNVYKFILDMMPIKFPAMEKSYVMAEKFRKFSKNIDIIDPKISSFELAMQCKNCFTNGSSLALESAMVGCRVFNTTPTIIVNGQKWADIQKPFDGFKNRIHMIHGAYAKRDKKSITKLMEQPSFPPMDRYRLKMEKAIEIITK